MVAWRPLLFVVLSIVIVPGAWANPTATIGPACETQGEFTTCSDLIQVHYFWADSPYGPIDVGLGAGNVHREAGPYSWNATGVMVWAAYFNYPVGCWEASETGSYYYQGVSGCGSPDAFAGCRGWGIDHENGNFYENQDCGVWTPAGWVVVLDHHECEGNRGTWWGGSYSETSCSDGMILFVADGSVFIGRVSDESTNCVDGAACHNATSTEEGVFTGVIDLVRHEDCETWDWGASDDIQECGASSEVRTPVGRVAYGSETCTTQSSVYGSSSWAQRDCREDTGLSTPAGWVGSSSSEQGYEACWDRGCNAGSTSTNEIRLGDRATISSGEEAGSSSWTDPGVDYEETHHSSTRTTAVEISDGPRISSVGTQSSEMTCWGEDCDGTSSREAYLRAQWHETPAGPVDLMLPLGSSTSP